MLHACQFRDEERVVRPARMGAEKRLQGVLYALVGRLARFFTCQHNLCCAICAITLRYIAFNWVKCTVLKLSKFAWHHTTRNLYCSTSLVTASLAVCYDNPLAIVVTTQPTSQLRQVVSNSQLPNVSVHWDRSRLVQREQTYACGHLYSQSSVRPGTCCGPAESQQ